MKKQKQQKQKSTRGTVAYQTVSAQQKKPSKET